MADLRCRNRGQIILVTAFALAVTFVALALIVNSAIFTENLASRGEIAGSDDALSMRAMVENNVGRSIETANRLNYSGDLSGTVEQSIRNVSTQTEFQQSTTGALVNVTYESHRDGTRITQNSSSQLTFEAGTKSDYVVVRDVSRVDTPGGNGTRAFRIDASEITATDNDSAFEVKVNATTDPTGNEDSWRMQVWNSTDTQVSIKTIRNDSGTTTSEQCTVDTNSSSFNIDVTGGTVNGQPCNALRTAPSGENFRFASGAGDSYDIYFRNADMIAGNFSMVVHDDGVTVPDTISSIGAGNPYNTTALYDVTVRYTYDTQNMGYETDIRVAPGEPNA